MGTVKDRTHTGRQNVALSDVGGVSSLGPTSVGSGDAIGVASDQANANRLQRQKAGSRKTFKFRKTRKDVRRLKTMTENISTSCNNQEDTTSALELAIQQQQEQQPRVLISSNSNVHL